MDGLMGWGDEDEGDELRRAELRRFGVRELKFGFGIQKSDRAGVISPMPP